VQDANGDPVPDTYPGSGDAAPLDPTLAQTYLGADNNFIDVYRFRYSMSSTAARVVTFSLDSVQAQTFGSLVRANGVWGPANPQNAMAILATGVSVPVITPAPGAAALLGLGGLVVARRRRTA